MYAQIIDDTVESTTGCGFTLQKNVKAELEKQTTLKQQHASEK